MTVAPTMATIFSAADAGTKNAADSTHDNSNRRARDMAILLDTRGAQYSAGAQHRKKPGTPLAAPGREGVQLTCRRGLYRFLVLGATLLSLACWRKPNSLQAHLRVANRGRQLDRRPSPSDRFRPLP